MERSQADAQMAASAMGVCGFMMFVAVTFVPPTNGAPWLWAEIVGPLWVVAGLLAALIAWRFRLRKEPYAAYDIVAMVCLGLLGLGVMMYLERRSIGLTR